MTGSSAVPAGEAGSAVTYILPLRRPRRGDLEDLPEYLSEVLRWAEVLVVDGSPPHVFAAHARLLPPGVRHLPPERTCLNGKVSGVLTGLARARTELLVIADDDVRYTAAGFNRVVELLDSADLVRPQNFFTALPWHARWDTARTLINRALLADYPGTLGVRRSALAATDGYDGDVLFENLELIRTVRAAGGREIVAASLFVPRIPCSARQFRNQRVRQAYDGFAQPVRLAVELSLVPALAVGARRAPASLAVAAVLAVGVAELGRRRDGGAAVFPASSALWAPLWVLERALTVWAAVGLRLSGGVPYAGRRITRAGTPLRVLRRRHAGKARRARLSAKTGVRPAPAPLP